ncbi:CoA ester lyase [Sporichthya brevicatena]|uniref:CoA ester lyase n=1 Tax=Sporichthya brevicatena TaxID=171442 RepID=A0ABP3RAI6_9ACTN
MTRTPFAVTRSTLFVPATRPDLVEKVGRSGADVVVLDLEDTVPPPAKAGARSALPALIDLLTSLATGTRMVRVNAPDSPWIGADLDALAAGALAGLDGLVVPKVDGPGSLDQLTKLADRAGLPELPILAGIESAQGVSQVEAIAPRVAAVYFGAEDFAADMRGRRTSHNTEVLYARSRVALAARVAEIPALDQVFFDVGDEAGFRREAGAARDLGYSGKMCLNPRQVRWSNEMWTPTPAETDWAVRAIAAYDEVTTRGEGVAFVDGRLIDLPVIRLARAVLAAAPRVTTEEQGA